MDLKDFEQQDIAEYVLETPAGDRLDVVFQLAGPSHPARVAFDRKGTARSLREFNRRGKAQLPDDPDALFEQQTDRLVAFTLGWSNLQIDGKAVPFSENAARDLYENRRFGWVRTAVAGALDDIGNFMRGSSRTSSSTSSTSVN